jgi:uroporphyrinogen decarboxylase
MNKIERVRAAIRGEPVDRVPAGFWTHFPEDQQNGPAMVRAHLDFYRRTDLDFLKVMYDNPYELVGVDKIRTPADWAKLRPAPLSSRPYQEYLDSIKEILDAVGNETLVITTMFNPFCIANDNRSGVRDEGDWLFDGITQHLRQDPTATAQGLKMIAESTVEFIQALLNVGVAGFLYSVNGSNIGRFSREQFDAWVKPSDLMVLQAAEQAGAEFVLLHICGANQRLEFYTDYPSQVVNWAPQQGNLSLKEGQALFNRTVMGGLDQNGALSTGPRAAIEAEVQAVLAEMGTQRFILGAGCAVAGPPPLEHYVWAKEALK